MKSIPSGWTERHVEAYEAWEAGDTERLCEACRTEINRAARLVAKVQGLLPWATTYLAECGRQGVDKAFYRYNPERKVPFQGYAWKDIYCETQRGAKVLLAAAEHPREAEEGSNANLEALTGEIQRRSCEWWRDIIPGLDIELLAALRNFLDEHRDALIATAGKNKFAFIRGYAGAYWTVRSMGENGFRDISGPINAQIIRGLHRSYNSPAESVSFSELGRLLGVSDKTAKRYYECWENTPPGENEDLFAYLYRIVDPRGYRRLRRRLNQESE